MQHRQRAGPWTCHVRFSSLHMLFLLLSLACLLFFTGSNSYSGFRPQAKHHFLREVFPNYIICSLQDFAAKICSYFTDIPLRSAYHVGPLLIVLCLLHSTASQVRMEAMSSALGSWVPAQCLASTGNLNEWMGPMTKM